jgi:hypothetical protein
VMSSVKEFNEPELPWAKWRRSIQFVWQAD